MISANEHELFFARAAGPPEADRSMYVDIYDRMTGNYSESILYDLDCIPVLYVDRSEIVTFCDDQLTRFQH